MRAGGSLPLSIICIKGFLNKNLSNNNYNYNDKIQVAKMNVGTDEKVSQNQNLAKKLSIMLKNAGG